MFLRPVPLTNHHQIAGFDSSEPVLDEWLVRKALQNEERGFSRTFVSLTEAGKMAGFYSISAGGISRSRAPKQIQRNSPDPIPVIVLGRLAVDVEFQGCGLGGSLLQDAIVRVAGAAEAVGIALIMVSALNQAAANFYLNFGFQASPFDPMVLFLPVGPSADSRQTDLKR
ncbi:MAG: GNAT family N-acetyltransferase [Actinomycetes bacterium]